MPQQPIMWKLRPKYGARPGGRADRGIAPWQGGSQLPTEPPIVLTGVTKNSVGAALGGCIVQLFETATDRFVVETVSDPTTGVFVFYVGLGTGPYYAVAYLAGAPDVAGTTVNTLVGV